MTFSQKQIEAARSECESKIKKLKLVAEQVQSKLMAIEARKQATIKSYVQMLDSMQIDKAKDGLYQDTLTPAFGLPTALNKARSIGKDSFKAIKSETQSLTSSIADTATSTAHTGIESVQHGAEAVSQLGVKGVKSAQKLGAKGVKSAQKLGSKGLKKVGLKLVRI